MSLDLSKSAAFQGIRAKEKARFEAASQKAAEKARDEAVAAGKPRMAGCPMTFEAVLQTCKDNDGYELPELNEKLYLHFKGFARVENLERFTQCKALFLESNGLSVIEGVSALTELRCLYLQQNLIEHILPRGVHAPPDGVSPLATLCNLVTLDLSQNRLTVLEGLAALAKLNTLNVAQNLLGSVEGIAHLTECPSITNVDLSKNELADPAVLDVLDRMPALSALKIEGNGCIRDTPGFRKNALHRMPRLLYLDRPIDEMSRAAAHAFVEGGKEAEIATRRAYCTAEQEGRKDSLAGYVSWQQKMAARRRDEMAAEAAANPDGPAPSIWRSHVSIERRNPYPTRGSEPLPPGQHANREFEEERREAELRARGGIAAPDGGADDGAGVYEVMAAEAAAEEEEKKEKEEEGEEGGSAAGPATSPSGSDAGGAKQQQLLPPPQQQQQQQEEEEQEQKQGGEDERDEDEPEFDVAASRLPLPTSYGAWSEGLEADLPALAKACGYDFEKVALALNFQAGRADKHGKPTHKSTLGPATAPLTAEQCRLRLAKLKVAEQQRRKDVHAARQRARDEEKRSGVPELRSGAEIAAAAAASIAAVPPVPPAAAAPAPAPAAATDGGFAWTAELDAALPQLVRAHAFDFEKVAAAVVQRCGGAGGGAGGAPELLDATACRVRFARVGKKGAKKKKKSAPEARAAGAGGAEAPAAAPPPVQRFTPAPRGLTFEQLMSQATAYSTPAFAPKCLPSMGSDSEDGGAGSDDDVKPLSRGDIEREIAGGRIAKVTNMTELD